MKFVSLKFFKLVRTWLSLSSLFTSSCKLRLIPLMVGKAEERERSHLQNIADGGLVEELEEEEEKYGKRKRGAR